MARGAYYCCKDCKVYSRLGWPEFSLWFEQHGQHRVFMHGFDPPEDFKSAIGEMEELSRECQQLTAGAPAVSWGLRRSIFFPAEQYEEAARGIPLRPCPRWLGNFSFRFWGGGTPDPVPFPAELASLVVALEEQVPTQDFNTVYLQRYERGQEVRPHRDPRSNVGYTVIGTFGKWEGGITSVFGAESFQMRAGDAAVLPCTISGVQGPQHQVTPVKRGTRWALILGTTR